MVDASGAAGEERQATASALIAGVRLGLLPEGALYWPDEKTLVVADLHLEKGSAFAARGQMLPPYDTAATLARLEALLARLGPDRVIALGDSFHDSRAGARMTEEHRARLVRLTGSREWIWIAGNHDPAPPAGVGGIARAELRLGPLTFRHEPRPGALPGEIAGHLHPAARIVGRGRGSGTATCSVSVACTVVMMPRSIGTLAVKIRIAALNPVNAFRPVAFTHAPRLKNGLPAQNEPLREIGPSPMLDESNQTRHPPKIESRPDHGHELEMVNRDFKAIFCGLVRVSSFIPARLGGEGRAPFYRPSFPC